MTPDPRSSARHDAVSDTRHETAPGRLGWPGVWAHWHVFTGRFAVPDRAELTPEALRAARMFGWAHLPALVAYVAEFFTGELSPGGKVAVCRYRAGGGSRYDTFAVDLTEPDSRRDFERFTGMLVVLNRKVHLYAEPTEDAPVPEPGAPLLPGLLVLPSTGDTWCDRFPCPTPTTGTEHGKCSVSVLGGHGC